MSAKQQAEARGRVRDQVSRDAELVGAVLEREDLEPDARERFTDMLVFLERHGPLSPKQREWATAVLEGRRYEAPVEYANLISSGRAPRGREVAMLVKDHPLKPPRRPVSDE